VRSRHQKRPQREPDKSGLHADAEPPANAETGVPYRPSEQYDGAAPAQRRKIQEKAQSDGCKEHDGNRSRMPEGDREPGCPHDPSVLPVEPESDGKEPPHRRIYPVEKAEPGQCQPGP